MPKERWRIGKGGGYTPTKTKDFQALCRVCFLAARRSVRFPDGGAVEVNMRALFPIPPSWPLWRRDLAATEAYPHLSVPDKDNVEKAVLDGLKGVAWTDDSRVYVGTTGKWYSETPRTEVEIVYRCFPANHREYLELVADLNERAEDNGE